jgi:asparagine synthetase B (glutamine-hydrolysing)
MSGIILSIGEKAKSNFETCFQNFMFVKDLKLNYLEKEDLLCIAKYCRSNEQFFKNIVISDNIKIWYLGFIIYKNYIDLDAVKNIKDDIKARNYSINEIAKNLDGQFFLLINDSINKYLWMITDHVGIINIYKYNHNDNFVISSSSMALSRSFSVTPNQESILEFLRNGCLSNLNTIYNEIELLEPGSIYRIDYKNEKYTVSKEIYWKSPCVVNNDLDFEESKNIMIKILNKNTEIFRNENFLCDFTAGFDTRLLLSSLLACKNSLKKLNTFTFGPKGSTELLLVKEYCKNLNIINFQLSLPYNWEEIYFYYIEKSLSLTDGEENVFIYAPILWAQEYKIKQFELGINGSGGELYRNFWWEQEIFLSKKPANLNSLIRNRILQYEYTSKIFSLKFRHELDNISDILIKKYLKLIEDMNTNETYNTSQLHNLYLRQRMRRWLGRTMSTSNQIIKNVSPLMFKNCLDFVMKIPPGYKKNGRLVKAIVEKNSQILSDQKMITGIPCQNISIYNFFKFLPFLTTISKKGLRKISQRVFKRTIFLDKSLTYNNYMFIKSFYSNEKVKKLLSYDNMCTKDLYDKENFNKFIKDAQKPDFRYFSQFGNIVTLELRTKNDQIKNNINF